MWLRKINGLVRLLILTIALPVSALNNDPEQMGSQFRFNEDEVQEAFLHILAKRSVPFHVRNDGSVLYHTNNQVVIKSAAASTIGASEFSMQRFMSEREQVLASKKLSLQRILHANQRVDGEHWTLWAKKDDVKVKAVIRKVVKH